MTRICLSSLSLDNVGDYSLKKFKKGKTSEVVGNKFEEKRIKEKY